MAATATPQISRWPHLITLVTALTLAAGITAAEVAWPQVHTLITDRLDPAPATQQAAPAPAKPAPAAAVTPAPAVPAAPVAKTATTNQFVHVREAKSTSSPIVVDIEAGNTVQLREGGDATWQAVSYQDHVGYIYKEYLSY